MSHTFSVKLNYTENYTVMVEQHTVKEKKFLNSIPSSPSSPLQNAIGVVSFT